MGMESALSWIEAGTDLIGVTVKGWWWVLTSDRSGTLCIAAALFCAMKKQLVASASPRKVLGSIIFLVLLQQSKYLQSGGARDGLIRGQPVG